jgi:hypothetical protein
MFSQLLQAHPTVILAVGILFRRPLMAVVWLIIAVVAYLLTWNRPLLERLLYLDAISVLPPSKTAAEDFARDLVTQPRRRRSASSPSAKTRHDRSRSRDTPNPLRRPVDEVDPQPQGELARSDYEAA